MQTALLSAAARVHSLNRMTDLATAKLLLRHELGSVSLLQALPASPLKRVSGKNLPHTNDGRPMTFHRRLTKGQAASNPRNARGQYSIASEGGSQGVSFSVLMIGQATAILQGERDLAGHARPAHLGYLRRGRLWRATSLKSPRWAARPPRSTP